MRGPLPTPHGPLTLPAFLPDATHGVVRAVDSADLEACGVEALVVNALHLATKPGAGAIASAGGIHAFMNWRGPVLSDSGGFQLYSLATGGAGMGSVSPHGFTWRTAPGAPKQHLTPEKAIERQFQLGADLMVCLDYCTHPAAPAEVQRESVRLTVAWARRCKETFLRLAATREPRPLLFAVVQGGADPHLRRACALELLEIGFDGYAFGGWPVSNDGALVEAVAWVREHTPRDRPLHALGIGKPENVVRAARMGYDLFDCVIPTRDARHRRLYAATDGLRELREDGTFYYNLYLQDEKYHRDHSPVEPGCDCHCCRRYTRAYLYHLFEAGEVLAQRLATIHNLHFYARLMARLRAG
ncbi:MAG: tRNA guanosine(34) transglycosylase Tgt [Armatimonadota bacterium]|nr:tRNA guanosine(34) transglycosylase Tgt [Armatimonadota bacterium]